MVFLANKSLTSKSKISKFLLSETETISSHRIDILLFREDGGILSPTLSPPACHPIWETDRTWRCSQKVEATSSGFISGKPEQC